MTKLYRFRYGDTYEAPRHVWNFMRTCCAEIDPEQAHNFRYITPAMRECNAPFIDHIVGIEFLPYVSQLGESRYLVFFLLDDLTARMMWRLATGWPDAFDEPAWDVEVDSCSLIAI